ncbi:MAG: ATP-grasp domain-containing protein [Candidatus Omnitrophica bacterium]|nr:ATP-grasp domain-containing protein [Candidatus Omnitrophota bacterium]MCB9720205.1 ATP-grasp domain-containing protein [Candidatus Omnitrophota bacterium]
MSPRPQVLVIGTTADYIDDLRQRAPGRLLFVTDPAERERFAGPAPAGHEEILCPLEDPDLVTTAVRRFVERHNVEIAGITCYDCESLALTAHIAAALGLPFHSAAAIARARSKFHAKLRWQEAGLTAPRVKLMRNVTDVLEFWRAAGRDIVLKPLAGSGSEFVFRCRDEQACLQAIRTMQTRIPVHPNRRMYALERLPDHVSPVDTFCAETYVGGAEYSCDAVISNGELRVVRLTKKLPFEDEEFGTTMAYQILNDYPRYLPERELRVVLKNAARSLGLYHAWFMADFKLYKNRIWLLEVTPRPGGDCLPALVSAAGGPDMRLAVLDFAAGQRVSLPQLADYRPLVGLQCFASRAGRLRRLEMPEDFVRSKLVQVCLNKRPGDVVRLPPEDYDSRKLGTIIFEPVARVPVEAQCREIRKALKVEMEETVHAT